MAQFLQSENFMKLVYVAVACSIIALGFVNKQEVIQLYKYTLSTCS